MQRLSPTIPLLLVTSLLPFLSDTKAAKIDVLIVNGMNNHDWRRATSILRETLESSGLFDVDVATSAPDNASIDCLCDPKH